MTRLPPERIAEIEGLLVNHEHVGLPTAREFRDAIRDLLAEREASDQAMRAFVTACLDPPDDGGPFDLPPKMETIYEHARRMRSLLQEPPHE